MANSLWRTVFVFVAALCCSNVYAVTCEFSLQNEWNSGFTSSVTLTNETDQSIEGWAVSLNFSNGSQITGMWNATLSGNNPYTATHKNYNRTIPPNSTVSFGFNTQKAVENTPAQSPTLGGICSAGNTNNPPTAQASALPTTGEIPLTVNFDGGRSTDPEGAPLTYLWDFGDGSTSTEAAPTYTFTTAGIYTVDLIVNDGQQNSASTQLTIQATAAETTSAACEVNIRNEWGTGFTTDVRMTNVGNQPINGWAVLMDFANRATVTQIWNANLSGNDPYQATNKNYNRTIGPNSTIEFGFNARKTVNNTPAQIPTLGGLCDGADGAPNQAPVANFSASPTTGSTPLTVVFDASGSNDPDGDTLTYAWNFGDGNTTNTANPTHTYTTTGTHTVTLTVTDAQGAQDSKQTTITANQPLPTQAYVLDANASSLYFVSTKKVHVIETHTFTELSGEIASTGAAIVHINLDSVDTGIDIRNERMRNFLFETSTFSQSTITLTVDVNQLANLNTGDAVTQTITPLVDLHGLNVPIETQARITKLNANTLLVQNISPILLKAADFDLTAGINALRDIAGLSVISYTVPTNFTLVFKAQ